MLSILLKGITALSTDIIAWLGIAGIILFPVAHITIKKKGKIHPLTVVLLIFLFSSTWRAFVIQDRRYALPLILFTLIGAVYLLYSFHQVKCLYYPIAFLFLGIVVYTTIKAFHLPETKDQLRVVEEITNKDDMSLLIQLGNPGGVLNAGNAVVVDLGQTYNAKQFADDLKNYYDPLLTQNIYSKVLFGVWGFKNGEGIREIPYGAKEIFYSKLKRNGREYRLFQFERNHNGKAKSIDEIKLLFRNNNILENPDFSKSRRITSETDFVKALKSFPEISDFPQNWIISTMAKGYFDMKDNLLIHYETNSSICFTVTTPDLISLWHEGKGIPPGDYAGLFVADVAKQSRFAIFKAYYSSPKENYLRGTWAYPISFSKNDEMVYVFPIHVEKDTEMQPAIYLFSGRASLKSLDIIPIDCLQ